MAPRCAFRSYSRNRPRLSQKGRSVYVEGRLRTRKWTDQNGNDRWTTEVVCENMQLLGGRDGSGQGGPSGSYVPAGDGFESAPRPAAPRSPAAAPQPQASPAAASAPIDSLDEDVPF